MNGLVETLSANALCLIPLGITAIGWLSARGLNRIDSINRRIIEPLYMDTVNRRYEISGSTTSPEQHEKYAELELLGIAIRFLFGDPHRHRHYPNRK